MEPKEDYYRIQKEKTERGGTDFRFPILAELCNDWKKQNIPVGELMEREDLQIFVGEPTEWAYSIWKQTDTTKITEIAKHFDTIRQYLPQNEENKKHIEGINSDLAKLVIYNQEEGKDYPLFILESQLMAPYTSGHIIDGNHRLISLLKELKDGNIQESTPIPVWKCKIEIPQLLAYNTISFLLRDKKPLFERLHLLKQRVTIQ